MSLILNVLWLCLGGLVLAVEWLIAGLLSIIFIITIPFASGCFEMAKSCLMPFGKDIVLKNDIKPRPISAFFWIIFAGIWLALSHLISGIMLCCTIVGIPFGLQNFKLIKVAFNPYKYTLVEKN